MVRGFQMSLSRFLPDFDEILVETAKLKQRVAPLIQSYKDQNYV